MRDGQSLFYKIRKKIHTEETANCWEVTHQIMCICNAHDLHQQVININNDDIYRKSPFSRFIIGSVNASKTGNAQEEKKHHPFNFYLKRDISHELLKIRREVKIHKYDRRKNFTQGPALKPE